MRGRSPGKGAGRNPGATLGIPRSTRFARFFGFGEIVLSSLFLSLFRARARSSPAFRSHTDTAGLIRVRLTYCLITGPPRERKPSRLPCRAAPRRIGHFSRHLVSITIRKEKTKLARIKDRNIANTTRATRCSLHREEINQKKYLRFSLSSLSSVWCTLLNSLEVKTKIAFDTTRNVLSNVLFETRRSQVRATRRFVAIDRTRHSEAEHGMSRPENPSLFGDKPHAAVPGRDIGTKSRSEMPGCQRTASGQP